MIALIPRAHQTPLDLRPLDTTSPPHSLAPSSTEMLSSGDLFSHPSGVPCHEYRHNHHHRAALPPQHHLLSPSCRHSHQQHQVKAAVEHRMDHNSATSTCEKPWTPLNSLSAELLVLIFQQVRPKDQGL
ncbi:hypothetical protein LIA77_08329 [Sarocladium implicatum]|nr:hypothetical protein LIA77_08329 [Sarocladium implicatum]